MVTVSMRVMSAGDGYKYLLRTVASGDGDRDLSTPLTRYYAEKGSPPGRWLGSAVAALGGSAIKVGDQVTETQLQLLVGMGHDPVTGDALGSAYRNYPAPTERIQKRTAALDSGLGPMERAEAVAVIEEEEAARGTRRAVAGFDFTFSIPKSASVLWAVSDAGTQSLIADAHHAAVAEMIAFIEREVAATRVGATGRNGAVAQVDVTGLIATAFDHYDSRAGDPHLHTHVVISNKVQTAHDEKWRSLDGRPLHAATVALSELHEAVFADHLTRTFGVEWETRDMGRNRNPAWAISTVPEELVVEFSSRARHIEQEKNRLIAEYVERHGRQPSLRTIIKLRAQATLSTRPEKQVRSVADLTTAIPPARQLNLPHLIEREIRCRARGLEQPRNMPSDTTEPIFQECDLGGAVASVVADPLSGAGTKAQRCFGLTWLAPGPDRGHESAGVVVQLIPVVEFFERRSGEPCRVQPERMDEVLFPPKSGRPNCRM